MFLLFPVSVIPLCEMLVLLLLLFIFHCQNQMQKYLHPYAPGDSLVTLWATQTERGLFLCHDCQGKAELLVEVPSGAQVISLCKAELGCHSLTLHGLVQSLPVFWADIGHFIKHTNVHHWMGAGWSSLEKKNNKPLNFITLFFALLSCWIVWLMFCLVSKQDVQLLGIVTNALCSMPEAPKIVVLRLNTRFICTAKKVNRGDEQYVKH